MPKPAVAPPESHVETACPLDCPDACTLQRDAARRPHHEDRRIAAQRDHARLHLRQGPAVSSARLRRRPRAPPGARRGRKGAGSFRPVTWDDALELIAAKIAGGSHGSSAREAILPLSYGGSNGLLTQDTTDAMSVPPARRLAPAAHGLRRADRRREQGALRQDAVGELSGLSGGAA